MAKIIFVTGGQRAGKSSFAEKKALELSDKPTYLATSRIWDEGHRKRIERHQKDRGDNWHTVEEEKELSKHDFRGKVVVMDCVTLWLNNYFFDNNNDIDLSLEQAKAEFSKLSQQDATFIVVSNEIGMGGHPTNKVAMLFTDLQGWTNQFIASVADEVFLLVSGIPVKIK